MAMRFTMGNNGSITSWVDVNGKNILFPAVTIDGKPRGYSHLCFPFGQADGDDFPAGTPQHGWIREGQGCHEKSPVQPLENTQADGSGAVIRFTNPGYFVPSSLHLGCFEETDGAEQTMLHRLTLVHDSMGEQPIPVSLGVHWYFATHGQNFTLHQDEGESLSWVEIQDLNGVPLVRGTRTITLETVLGQMQIEIDAGYDEFIVWSDRVNQYVCIEPVVGRERQFRPYLQPGNQFEGCCRLTYRPKT